MDYHPRPFLQWPKRFSSLREKTTRKSRGVKGLTNLVRWSIGSSRTRSVCRHQNLTNKEEVRPMNIAFQLRATQTTKLYTRQNITKIWICMCRSTRNIMRDRTLKRELTPLLACHSSVFQTRGIIRSRVSKTRLPRIKLKSSTRRSQVHCRWPRCKQRLLWPQTVKISSKRERTAKMGNQKRKMGLFWQLRSVHHACALLPIQTEILTKFCKLKSRIQRERRSGVPKKSPQNRR